MRLDEYRSRELVAVLRELTMLAEDGIATGLAFVVKVGQRDHRAGAVGDYKRRPEEALSATFRLERLLRQDLIHDTEESGT